MSRTRWPVWWSWELELTSHLYRRMEDRGFNEVQLRAMVDRAQEMIPDIVPGRWAIHTTHKRTNWCVVVEPDDVDELIVVITAYPLD